jgi:hypothetical protein
MIIKLTIGKWRFTFSVAPTTKVVGVNSNLPDGNHILMWDFDTGDYDSIKEELRWMQAMFNLPNVYTCKTGKKHGYHAFCFKALPWRKCVEILAATPTLDWNYFKFGVYRGHFTLRVSPKHARQITYLETLHSGIPEDCKPDDLQNWVQYETLQDGWYSKKVELKIYAKEK